MRKEKQPGDLVLLTKPTGEAELAFITSVLESLDIPFQVKNRHVQDLFGYGRVGLGYNVMTGPVSVMVCRIDLDKARDAIEPVINGPDRDIPEDPEILVLSTYHKWLNMSVVLGIFFPGLGTFPLVRAWLLNRRQGYLLGKIPTLLVSSVISFMGLILIFLLINKYFLSG